VANKRTAQRTGVGLAVAVAFAALAVWQWYQATGQRTIAQQRAKEAEAAQVEADNQRQVAVAEAEKALTQESRALATLAQNEIKAGNLVDGMLLALRGMPTAEIGVARPVVTETRQVRQALLDAILARREALVLRGHEQAVQAAAFSLDGTRIVSGSLDGTVRVWDAASGAELLVLRGHEGSVLAAGFSPDGARIVSGSASFLGEFLGGTVPGSGSLVGEKEVNTIRVWDVLSGAELLVLRGHEGPVWAAAFSPDGTRIVSGSGSRIEGEEDNTVRVWDAASGAELLVLRGHEGPVRAAAFSPDGSRT
jgi:WD40 repeat protein